MKGLVRSLESAPVGDGDLIGEPFKVLPYQRKFLTGAFKEGDPPGRVDAGKGWRKIRLGICAGAGLD